MERKEFLMEAALQLITAKPEADMAEIFALANNLTNRISPDEEQKDTCDGRWWDAETDTTPVSVLIGQIEKNPRDEGYASRLTTVFCNNDIQTVGDLLRIGRHTFKRYRYVGAGSMYRLDVALADLYNIQAW